MELLALLQTFGHLAVFLPLSLIASLAMCLFITK